MSTEGLFDVLIAHALRRRPLPRRLEGRVSEAAGAERVESGLRTAQVLLAKPPFLGDPKPVAGRLPRRAPPGEPGPDAVPQLEECQDGQDRHRESADHPDEMGGEVELVEARTHDIQLSAFAHAPEAPDAVPGRPWAV